MKENKISIIICILIFSIFSLNILSVWSTLTFYIISFIFILLFKRYIGFSPKKYLFYLFAPILIGILTSYNNELFEISKGFFYISIPVFVFVLGYNLMSIFSLNRILLITFIVGLIVSLIYIIIGFYNSGIEALINPYETVRSLFGSGSTASVLSFFILIYGKKMGIIKCNKFYFVLFLFINLLAIYLYASRTYYIQFFIFLLLYLFFRFKYRFILGIAFIFIFILIIGTFYIENISHYLTNSGNFFLFKIFNSFSELAIINNASYEDIYTNYRGFEITKSIQTFFNGSYLNLFFGQGLGAKINLGEYVYLSGGFLKEVPWIHNGYLLLLVKTGVLGLFFFVLFIYKSLKVGLKLVKSQLINIKIIGFIFLSTLIALTVTHYATSNFYSLNSLMPTILLASILKKTIK